MAMLPQNIDTYRESTPPEYASLVAGPAPTSTARRTFAAPDTTPEGTAAFIRDGEILGPVYCAAQNVVRHSRDLAAVRRAAACQAWIARRLGFGRDCVLGHLRRAANARKLVNSPEIPDGSVSS